MQKLDSSIIICVWETNYRVDLVQIQSICQLYLISSSSYRKAREDSIYVLAHVSFLFSTIGIVCVLLCPFISSWGLQPKIKEWAIPIHISPLFIYLLGRAVNSFHFCFVFYFLRFCPQIKYYEYWSARNTQVGPTIVT